MRRQVIGGVVLSILALVLTSVGTKSTNRTPGNDLQLKVGLILLGCSILLWIVIAVRYSQMSGKSESRGFNVIEEPRKKKSA